MAGLPQGVETIETVGIGSALFRTMALSAKIPGFKATDLYSNQGRAKIYSTEVHISM